MKISYSKTFEKKFLKYNKKLQEKIFQAIQALPSGDVKRLTGNKIPPVYRVRISKYRILFHMNDDVIKVLKVDSRGDIYK
ncbi:MAG: type II toxin-antitoxin system RelE/ParE family toxin [Thiotrichales bacterium]|jgi:mRNA interferase RelE/StbE|nr:type II toxin-antitoxin system RelE/ParE family toxin [Thiotrichales bacterium]MBT3752763.1 type II toxin-antitoxin system RelE/ParE family toxin [Thiotrichales bacterium]MBT5292074.1 type II toxin-antitoxin system RelE/ParE family toxin [Thiotrichales bacterium]MBT6173641.1 type II toxin-antitoxin system RelE/ParE family toxin [Thiotrichales bacterium]MBT7315312.1 type II toxin-antitoxin system RelE/ParE family toxin [Thiotrichales bacterium]